MNYPKRLSIQPNRKVPGTPRGPSRQRGFSEKNEKVLSGRREKGWSEREKCLSRQRAKGRRKKCLSGQRAEGLPKSEKKINLMTSDHRQVQALPLHRLLSGQ